jgi:hypothetical protein
MITGNDLCPELKFDEEAHVYTVGDDEYRSVSTVISDFGFGGKSYEGIPSWALRLGTLRHYVTELDDLGVLEESTVHERLVPALNAWRKWRDDNPLAKPIAIEAQVADSKLLIAGTIDRVFEYEDEIWVVDIKGQSNSPTYQLQITAYARMWEALTKQKVNKCLTVHLGKGTYKERELQRADDDWLAIATTSKLMRECAYGRRTNGQ